MDDVRRALVFGEVADQYDDARPSYPVGVVDLVVEDGPARAVDVGCGTGKAARPVMERGVAVLGIEPDERMAAVARRHGAQVVCSTFEEWPAERHDCVFSAQAWHWVDPVRGAAKAAEVLPPGGRWIAVWNREDDELVTDVLADAYRRFAPHLLDERRAAPAREAAMVDATAGGLTASGCFDPMQRHDLAWTDRLTVARLVDRLATHSAHRLLEPATADALHGAVVEALGGPDALITLSYTTLVLTTHRR